MYVCICNAVTDRAVREAAAQGVRCVGELTMRTGCGGGCGACVGLAEEILQESLRQQADCACASALAA
jgi:bacterioferritin-associated ferredoxin